MPLFRIVAFSAWHLIFKDLYIVISKSMTDDDQRQFCFYVALASIRIVICFVLRSPIIILSLSLNFIPWKKSSFNTKQYRRVCVVNIISVSGGTCLISITVWFFLPIWRNIRGDCMAYKKRKEIIKCHGVSISFTKEWFELLQLTKLSTITVYGLATRMVHVIERYNIVDHYCWGLSKEWLA